MVWDRLGLPYYLEVTIAAVTRLEGISAYSTPYFLNPLRCQNQLMTSLPTDKTLEKGPCIITNAFLSLFLRPGFNRKVGRKGAKQSGGQSRGLKN